MELTRGFHGTIPPGGMPGCLLDAYPLLSKLIFSVVCFFPIFSFSIFIFVVDFFGHSWGTGNLPCITVHNECFVFFYIARFYDYIYCRFESPEFKG